MNHTLRFTLATLALVAANSAQAGVEIVTNTVNFASLNEYDWNMEPLAGHLLSSSNSATSIALTSYGRAINFPLGSNSTGDIHNGIFSLRVNNGFRVTGITFSGTLSGVLQPALARTEFGYDSQPGSATNSADMGLKIGSSPFSDDLGRTTSNQVDINGNRQFSLSVNHLNLTGEKNVEIGVAGSYNTESGIWTYAVGDVYYSGIDPSYASIAMLNPTLTIYTAAVPEPETYGMMLAGLAGLGFVMRRRHANKA